MLDFHYLRDGRFELAEDADALFASHLEQALLRNDHRVAVALREAQVVGYVHTAVLENLEMFRIRRYGLLSDLAVAPEMRRQGIGMALWHAAQQWFSEQGISSVQLNVSEANPEAQEFWRACGFREFLKVLWCDLA